MYQLLCLAVQLLWAVALLVVRWECTWFKKPAMLQCCVLEANTCKHARPTKQMGITNPLQLCFAVSMMQAFVAYILS